MKELIKVTTNNNGERLVSARELYEFLGLSKRFSAWFETYSKNEIYGFIENEDYTGCTQKYVANQHGAEAERQDYAITINMAKELSMLSKTEKGKQARRYFIQRDEILSEVEKELKNIESSKEDKIIKLLSIIPEKDRTNTMIKLVDKFYPTGIEKEKNKFDENKLTFGKVKEILNESLKDGYITTKKEFTVIKKEVVYNIIENMGINKRKFNLFLLKNKLLKGNVVYSQTKIDGKNSRQYFIRTDFLEK